MLFKRIPFYFITFSTADYFCLFNEIICFLNGKNIVTIPPIVSGGHMPHSVEDKKRILTRVRRIRGQVDALERALESGEPCLAILQQIAAVRGASNGLMGEMIEIHLKDELVGGETTPDQRAVKMAEISHLLRTYLK
ncbi:conserved hypothetical protein; similarity with yaiN [Escherichia fergusonii ATCC 35469]|uniref:Transcriptional repressor FrmR n=3 Tax=Enterobacteriaceae TaxID=543 RepID=B7LRF7_ESCF3|nr:conserved hypothetical protein; similarity with yaiN [Escherichia fergusonii ATCC 35469]